MADETLSDWIPRILVYVFIVSVFGTHALEDHPSPSFVSPNSAGFPDADDRFHRIQPTSTSGDFVDVRSRSEVDRSRAPTPGGQRDRRDADPLPILSQTATDDLILYKNVEDVLDHNDVELSGRIGGFIQPSRTESSEPSNLFPPADPLSSMGGSGEGWGGPQPQARALREPPSATTASPSASRSVQTPGDRPRQASPDIQDIITGLVKLLNGNVNVQANTSPPMGRPPRPLSTRINNRGPPRITDLPALPPDFDVPAPLPPPALGPMPPPLTSTRLPAPYPFDVPPPVDTSPAHRPPWKHRRPLPPHRPLPPDAVGVTSQRPPPNVDVLTLDLGGQLGGEIADFERNKEKFTKLDKYTSKTTIVTPTFNTESSLSSTSLASTSTEEQPSATSTVSTPPSASKTSTDATSTFTGSLSETTVAPTSVSQTPAVTSTVAVISNATGAVEGPLVESSILEVVQTTKETGLETEKLPTTSGLLSGVTSSVAASTRAGSEVESSASSATPTTMTNETAPPSTGFPYRPYRPRPGIVLDDTEYKPGGGQRQTRPPVGQIGDIFDITVSAIQGPGGGATAGQGKPYVIPVDLELNAASDVITSPSGEQGFVSIDGKRTYLNLFGEGAATGAATGAAVRPTAVAAIGYATVEGGKAGGKPPPRRGPVAARPSQQPPVRIDTCIVGDSSTCDWSQLEECRTEAGVSACHCRPGAGRRRHRDPCRRAVALLVSLRVDRLRERRVGWAAELADAGSAAHRQLAFEAQRALESAMSMTPFSDDFLAAKVNGIYRGAGAGVGGGVFVNATLQLAENADTSRPTVRADLQRHLLGVIQRRANNVGDSAVWVDGPSGAVSALRDVDECSSAELHDCHSDALCVNVFGGFRCECREGLKDPWADNRHRRGRQCEQCPPQRCNNRGECKYQAGVEVCVCIGNYYGNQCELDGEVLGVAIGASVAAVIIIGLTLVCLVMWSRRWSREQKAAVGSPVFGYMATASNTVKTPVVGGPPYQLTLEDRLRWAQIADVMAQANHYAPEPVLPAPTRPSSAMFGYAAGPPPPHHHLHRGGGNTLPPVPLPRLNLQMGGGARAATLQGGGGGRPPFDHPSSSSDDEDGADLLGRAFHGPRPKSRSNGSVANQSGIYYDVDYEPNDIYRQSGGIPLSTYSMGRPAYFRK